MMKIYLIRHAEVENPKHILYGRLPGFRLSHNGQKQARRCALALLQSGANIKRIFSSPLERATETAAIIAENLQLTEKEIAVSEELTEINFGKFQGISLDGPIEVSEIRKSPDVESPQKAGERVLNFLESVKADHDLAIISHGDPIMGIVCKLKNDPRLILTDYIRNCEYYAIEKIDGDWKIA